MYFLHPGVPREGCLTIGGRARGVRPMDCTLMNSIVLPRHKLSPNGIEYNSVCQGVGLWARWSDFKKTLVCEGNGRSYNDLNNLQVICDGLNSGTYRP